MNQRYMTSTRAYPIANEEREIVPLLRDAFCRAVVLRDPHLKFEPSGVMAETDSMLAARYWYAPETARGRLASGQNEYVHDVNEHIIAKEAKSAKIVFTPPSLTTFTNRCNAIRALFSRVFSAYTGMENPVLRGFTLFTPVGGCGRSPELHIDNTILTLHWSAALSSLSVSDNELDDDLWNALDRGQQNVMNKEDRALNYVRLVQAVAKIPLVQNRIGDIMITKGQLGLDLSKPEVRQAVCVHVSSPTIKDNGQAGFLMTPKISTPL